MVKCVFKATNLVQIAMRTRVFYDYDRITGNGEPPKRRRRSVTCKRCGGSWKVYGTNPVKCRHCSSAYWNRPRRNGISSARALRLQRKEEKVRREQNERRS